MARKIAGTVGTAKKRALFLEVLTETANVVYACKQARLSRRTVYNWRNTEAEFLKAWDEAVELGIDALEDEALRRGQQGFDKPVFHQGKQCGKVREYSDTLLIFMLKARRPEKFKERSQIDHKIPIIKQFMEAVSGKSRGLPNNNKPRGA